VTVDHIRTINNQLSTKNFPGYSTSYEGARITSQEVLENLTDAQWLANNGTTTLAVVSAKANHLTIHTA
jgi:hypothetical protein